MIKEIFISSYEELLPLFSEDQYNSDIKRYRSSYLYRGMPKASYKMTTTLARNCKAKKRVLEPSILKNFTKYASLEDPTLNESVWKQMMAGQHHGLPTRLLDWSHSALVGLHFATTEKNLAKMDKHDCMVWRIDVTELHSLLPEKYRTVMEKHKADIFSVDMLTEAAASVAIYDEDMGKKAMVVIEPPSISSRIVNQYSFFSIVPSDFPDVEDYLEKYTEKTTRFIIKKEIRWQVRDLLDKLNISERVIYPGLDGLSEWLARHYYVKNIQ